MTARHPLSDALAAAEHSPQAQAYEVPVELIRTRARRRSRARTGTAAGVLALVAAVTVVPFLPDDSPQQTVAAPSPSATPAWPGPDPTATAPECGAAVGDRGSTPHGIRWGVSDDGPDPRLRVSNHRDHAVRVTGADVVASRGGVVIGRTTADLPAHDDVSVPSGAAHLLLGSSGYGPIEWCPGVVPPEDFSTWLLVDVREAGATSDERIQALLRMGTGDDDLDLAERAARVTDVRFTTSPDGQGGIAVTATNTGTLPVLADFRHVSAVLEQRGTIVAQSLVNFAASPWEPLPAGGSRRLMTITLDQLSPLGGPDERVPGPALAWVRLGSDLGPLVAGPYEVVVP